MMGQKIVPGWRSDLICRRLWRKAERSISAHTGLSKLTTLPPLPGGRTPCQTYGTFTRARPSETANEPEKQHLPLAAFKNIAKHTKTRKNNFHYADKKHWLSEPRTQKHISFTTLMQQIKMSDHEKVIPLRHLCVHVYKKFRVSVAMPTLPLF